MHPRIIELFRHLDASRDALGAAVAAVPVDNRKRKVTPDQWSVAEIIEHLAIVERRITGGIRDRITVARAQGVGPETSIDPVVLKVDMNRVKDRTRRIESNSPPPTGTVDADTALNALDEARRDLKDVILQADGLDLSAVTMPHRVFGDLSIYDWIAFIGGHTARHTDQIRETAATLAAD